MVVRQVPRIVQGFLSVVSDQLGGPQMRHLNLTVTALLLVGSAKLKTLTHAVRHIGRHRTSLGHFLSRAFWPEADVLETASWRILKSMKPQRGEVVSLIIDDTRIAKRGRSMQALSRMWDHCNSRFCHGHTVVVAAIRFRGVVLPWRMQLWLPKDFAQAERLDYLKSTEIAAAMIRAFDPPAGLKVRVLFDAAYLCPKVTSACENRGFTWFSVAARNRNLLRDKGRHRKRSLADLGPGTLKHRRRHVRMKRSGGRVRWVHIAHIDGRLPRIGGVRIVFSKRPGDRWKNILAVATNETNLDARKILMIYETRWAIEVLMKELKGSLGLGQYQMQSWIGIVRHLHLVALSHLTLTHHALKRIGAQATKPHKDVPLPTFNQRITVFREDVQREQITRFTNRIRQPRVRQRVKEFLLAT